jgi:hypothetical protein
MPHYWLICKIQSFGNKWAYRPSRHCTVTKLPWSFTKLHFITRQVNVASGFKMSIIIVPEECKSSSGLKRSRPQSDTLIRLFSWCHIMPKQAKRRHYDGFVSTLIITVKTTKIIVIVIYIKKLAVFSVVAPCRLLQVYQRFRCPYCFHHQGDNHSSYIWDAGKLIPVYTHGATTQKTAIFLLTPVRTSSHTISVK